MEKEKIKILFFIGTLGSGGKERRLLELITFLNMSNKYSLTLVTKKSDVMFENFFDLDIEWISLGSKRLNVGSFFEFYNIVRAIKPDFIHTWGNKQTFVALPCVMLNKSIRLVNSQITSAPPSIPWGEKLISKINFMFSDIILSNSNAGIDAYNPPQSKSLVIYNGLNLNRFTELPDKSSIMEKLEITTPFSVIMIASYSKNKDYERFFGVGKELTKMRGDVTFLGIGFYENDESYFENALKISKGHPNLRPMPGTKEVESIVNACDIGVLFSNAKVHGEGISNAIIEYMALGKPVIANDAGGTREIVQEGWNGFLIHEESPKEIALKIHELLQKPDIMKEMGKNSRERILRDFSLKKMGTEFEKVYHDLML